MAFIPFIISFVIVCSAAAAESGSVDQNATPPAREEGPLESRMDDFQEYWSRKVLIFSSNLDHMFAEGSDDENVSAPGSDEGEEGIVDTKKRFSEPKFKEEENKETYRTSTWFDNFFKDETYLDTTNKSYVRVRGGYEYDKRGSSSTFYTVKARLRLPRTQEKLQLFIGGEPEEKISPSNTPRTSGGEGVGIKYFLPSLYGRLFTNASVGFSGIDNPYVKTHLEYPIFLESWLFKAAQNFKYSVENKFDEWTSFSFDRQLSDKDMVRLLLQRSTNSEVKGMEYLMQLSYLNTFHNDIATSYYVGFNGRTTDHPDSLYDNGLAPQEGIYEYSTGIVWRQPLFKQYLFYEIEPVLSFHEQYDFKPNYLLRFSVDLYFGSNK